MEGIKSMGRGKFILRLIAWTFVVAAGGMYAYERIQPIGEGEESLVIWLLFLGIFFDYFRVVMTLKEYEKSGKPPVS